MKRIAPTLLFLLLSLRAPAQAGGLAKVVGKSRTDDGISVSLQSFGKFETRSLTGPLKPSAMRAFRQLQSGREYAFPQRLQEPADDLASFESRSWKELERLPPFRAVVDRIIITEDEVSLFLCCADGHRLSFRHLGKEGLKEPREAVENVFEELEAEFPFILTAQKPQKGLDSALRQYVGEWQGYIDGDKSFHITMRCDWKADGSALWRTICYDDSSDMDPLYDVALISAGTEDGSYLAHNPGNSDKTPAKSRYSVSTRTFTTELPSAEPGITRINEAVFTDEDTIEWKTVTRSQSGAELSKVTGRYRRLPKLLIADGEEAVITSPSIEAFIDKAAGGGSTKISINNPSPPFAQTASFVKNSNSWAITKNHRIRSLKDFEQLPPLRMKLIQRDLSPIEVDLVFELIDETLVRVCHARTPAYEASTRVAEQMIEGKTYDFPQVLASSVDTQAVKAMHSLSPWLGEWKVLNADSQPLGITERNFWSADGSAMWNEVGTVSAVLGRPPATTTILNCITPDKTPGRYFKHFPPTTKKGLESIAGRKCIVSHFTVRSDGPQQQDFTWNESAQTHEKVVEGEPPGSELRLIRTFTSADRIEARMILKNADGSKKECGRNLYERIKP